MSAMHIATTVGAVTSERGEQIKARRTEIGMSVAALAKRAGVDRGSLSELEKGRPVRDTTVAQVERALAELEHELGMDVPSQVASVAAPTDPEPMRFTFHDIYGIGELIVEGPVDRPDELVTAVRQLLAEFRDKAV